MESVKSAYRILFDVVLELTGTNDDINQYIKLLPDESAQSLYASYRMLARKQKNTNVALIEVVHDGADQGKPLIMLKENDVFRFQVKLSQNSFIRRTNLSSYDFLTEVLYFSNTVNHVEGAEILLSLPATDYNASNSYKPGYIVKSGAAFYKALKESNNSDQHGVSETAYWKNITGGTFASQADLKTRASFTDPIDLDTIMVIEIRHSATLNASYQLLDGSLKCREITYKIKLQNAN